MAYLGKTPSQAVRSRYYFTATGGETSLSGADDNSKTLVFADGNYVDVTLNGVTLVAGTDYNTTTANTIGGLTALTASDVVEVVVYDTFSVFSGNVNGDFTVGGSITTDGLTTTGNINFGDNDKAIFGAGSDLQIYHNSSNNRSYITESGTGAFILQGENLILEETGGNNYIQATAGGAVQLYHNGSEKLATTSTGVDVTGTVTADYNITLEGASGGVNYKANSRAFFGSLYSSHFAMLGSAAKADETANSQMIATETSTGNGLPSAVQFGAGNIDFHTIASSTANAAFDNKRMRIDKNGDISFYDSTGTTQGLFWDASTQRLGLGTTSPAQLLHVNSSGNVAAAQIQGASHTAKVSTDGAGTIFGTTTNGYMLLTTNNAERMRIDSSGNVGIGTASLNKSSSSTALTVNTSSAASYSALELSSGNTLNWHINANNAAVYDVTAGTRPRVFYTNGSERMRLDSSGRLAIGTSSPTKTLDINTASATFRIRNSSAGNDFAFKTTAGPVSVVGCESNTSLALMTNDTERMRILSDGRTSIGHNAAINISILGISNRNATSDRMFAVHNAGGTSGYFNQIAFRNNADSANIGEIVRVNDASVSYNTTSDYRLKENAVDMTGAIERVKQLQPKRFNFIADDSTTVDGFMAHEAATVVPESVTGTHNEVDDDGNPVYQGIDQSKLVPLLTGALQEAITKIETLETQRADLEARLTALENA